MKESKVEKEVCDYAAARGFLVYKFVSPGRRGVPDRILIDCHGRPFFIEFKKAGEKPRPDQVREIKAIRANGGLVFVVDNIDYGKGVIDGFIN